MVVHPFSSLRLALCLCSFAFVYEILDNSVEVLVSPSKQ